MTEARREPLDERVARVQPDPLEIRATLATQAQPAERGEPAELAPRATLETQATQVQLIRAPRVALRQPDKQVPLVTRALQELLAEQVPEALKAL